MRHVHLVALAALVGFALWSVSLLLGLQGSAAEIERVQHLRALLDQAVTTWRDLNRPGNDVLGDYDAPRRTAEFEGYARSFAAATEAIRAAGDPALEALRQQLAVEAASMETHASRILTLSAERQRLVAAGSPAEEVRGQEVAAGQAMAEMDQAFQRGLDAIVAQAASLGGRLEKALGRTQGATRQLYLMLVVSLLAGAVALEVLRRDARQREAIRALTRASARIVEGDLSEAIQVDVGGDAQRLAETLGRLVDRLRGVPLALQGSTRGLLDVVSKLSAATSEHQESASRQAVALQETQVTAQEIKQTSKVASERAGSVLSVVQRAEEVGRAGEAAVERSFQGLTEIRTSADEIARRATELGQRTQQIGSITQTVKDLADQSNMLALNAAIEAVRSGEHGKGFAVVAREIRSLADQSIQATNRVREILEDVAGAVREVVSIAERGRQTTEAGLDQVKASGERLRELSTLSRETSNAARQIAAAVSQQNAGIEQIFAAVSDQTHMTTESQRTLEDTSRSVASLREIAGQVDQVIKTFKV